MNIGQHARRLLHKVWTFYVGSPDARTYSTRMLSFLAATMGIAWFFISLWLDVVPGMLAGFLLAFVSFFATTVVAYGYYQLGRVFWFVGASVVVLIGFFTLPERAYIDQIYAAIVAAVFMNFSFSKEKKLIFLVIGLIVSSWGMGLYLGRDYFGPSTIDPELAANVIAPLVTLTSIIGVAANVMIFGLLAERYYARQKAARAEADAANAAKSAFLASMSHEIRTPMNGVIGITELLAASELTEVQHRNIEMIRSSSQALLRIINDILDMSAIEAGRMVLVTDRMDLASTIEAAVEPFRAYADQCHVMVHLQLDPGLPSVVMGDADRVKQIIMNLLGNGIKFSRRPKDEPPGKAGLIVDQDPNGALRFVFSDNGIGIAEDFLANLFTPFQRAEAVTNQRFGGTGLGLSIVKQLVDKMDGQISVASRLGEGTQFTVILPLDIVASKDDLPDLTGHRVILLDLSPVQVRLWTGLLRAMNCNVIEAGPDVSDQTLAEMIGQRSTNTLVVLSLFDQTLAPRPNRLSDLRKSWPNVPVIAHSCDRTRASGLTDPHTFVLQSVPTLRSDALTAVRSMMCPSTKPVIEKQGKSAGAVPVAQFLGSILVVEDNEINQVVLEMQLKKLGHSVTLAVNGLEALAFWRSARFDMILTDCHMPEMDGYTLARSIREDEARNKLGRIPIVAITANVSADEPIRCHAVGIDEVLTKPIAFKSLAGTVDKYLRTQDFATAAQD